MFSSTIYLLTCYKHLFVCYGYFWALEGGSPNWAVADFLDPNNNLTCKILSHIYSFLLSSKMAIMWIEILQLDPDKSLYLYNQAGEVLWVFLPVQGPIYLSRRPTCLNRCLNNSSTIIRTYKSHWKPLTIPYNPCTSDSGHRIIRNLGVFKLCRIS